MFGLILSDGKIGDPGHQLSVASWSWFCHIPQIKKRTFKEKWKKNLLLGIAMCLWTKLMHYGSEQHKSRTSKVTFSHERGSELVSEHANKWSKQCVACKRVSSASERCEWTSKRASIRPCTLRVHVVVIFPNVQFRTDTFQDVSRKLRIRGSLKPRIIIYIIIWHELS